MLMVIFGAGASYDSLPLNSPLGFPSDAREHRLPLAGELFSARQPFLETMQQFPACKNIIPRLECSGNNVERVLEQIKAEGSTNPLRLKQLMAVKFYIQSVIHRCQDNWINRHYGITNHLSLIDEINHFCKGPICLVTFNYDTIIERALADFGARIRSFDDYVESNKFKLFKPHGSTNWGRLIVGGKFDPTKSMIDMAKFVVEQSEAITLSDTYVFNPGCPAVRDNKGQQVIPAIAIPLEKTKDFECPDTHLKAMQEIMPHITEILIVGWRAKEEHFIKLLRQARCGAHAFVVAGTAQEAQSIKEDLENNTNITARPSTSDGFSIAMKNGDIRNFLSALS